MWPVCSAAGVSGIFPDTEGFEKYPPLTLRRSLLEFVAIRYAVQDLPGVPLGTLLADAGISAKGMEASHVLRAVAQNNVVHIDH